jgi:hypothetical protein
LQDNDFQLLVTRELGEISRTLHELVGNGQPGRIRMIEDKLEEVGREVAEIKATQQSKAARDMAIYRTCAVIATTFTSLILGLAKLAQVAGWIK